MVTFESGLVPSEEGLIQLGQNLSSIVKDVLELSVSPAVIPQDSEGVFVLLIVTSSSQDANVAEGDLNVIKSKLSDDSVWSRLVVAAVSNH